MLSAGRILCAVILTALVTVGCRGTPESALRDPIAGPPGSDIELALVRRGRVEVRFRPNAVRTVFRLETDSRGLDRLKLPARDFAVLDSLHLLRVQRLRSQLEVRDGDHLTILTDAALRSRLGKPPRRAPGAAAFAGVERDMLLTFPPTSSLDAVCMKLRTLPSVEECRVTLIRPPLAPIIPNDAQFLNQWGLSNSAVGGPGQAPNFDVDAPEAWEVQKGSGTIVVAVIDFGVKVTHPDLYQKIWINVNELPSNFVTQANALSSDGMATVLTFIDLNAFSADASTQASMATLRASVSLSDTNGNGFIDAEDLLAAFANGVDDDPLASAGEIDDVIGWDAQNSDSWPESASENHGTAVAGLVAAVPDNGLHVAGVGWNVRIMAVHGDWSWPSVEYALKHGADIITSSLEPNSSAQLTALLAELEDEGVVFSAALGNADRYTSGTPYAESPYTIAVSNFRNTGTRDFGGGSGYSVNTDVAGPGAGTWSLTNTGSGGFGGTSGANPIVAGALSLMVSQRPGLTPEQYRQVLRFGAVDVPTVTGDQGENTVGFDYYSGWGLANARNSLNQIATDPWAEAKITSQPSTYFASQRVTELHIGPTSATVTGFAGIPNGAASQVALDWAPGSPPINGAWTNISSGAMPYTKDAALGTLNTNLLADGVNTLRLTVTGGARTFVDYARLDVPRAFLNLANNAIIATPTDLNGFAYHPQFSRYELQVAAGTGVDEANNALWSTVGPAVMTQKPPVPSGSSYNDQLLFTGVTPSSLSDGLATFRLALFDNANTRLSSFSVPVTIDNTVFGSKAGFPANLSYPYRSGGAVPYDLDGDGKQELIVTNQFEVHAFRSNGTELTGWPFVVGSSSAMITASPAIGDVSGDGLPEVVVRVTDYDSREDLLYVIGRDGNVVSPWPLDPGTYPGGCRTSTGCYLIYPIRDQAPVLADLDGDGDLEILLGGDPTVAPDPSGVFAFQGDGTLFHSYTVAGAQKIVVAPAVGDIDADGELDVVAITTPGPSSLTAWRASGSVLFSIALPAGFSFMMGTVLADLDGNKDLEIVVLDIDGTVRAYHHDGSLVNGFASTASGLTSPACYSISAADLNPTDGVDTPQIIMACYIDTDPAAAVYAYKFALIVINADGTLAPGWGTLLGTGDVAQQPSAADIDNDGVMEVLVGPYRQTGAGDPPFSAVVAVNHDGTLVADNRFPIYLGGGLVRSPAIADFDQDGQLDFGIASNKWGGPVDMFALDAVSDGGAVAWGMHHHNPRRTSAYHDGIRLLEPTTTRQTNVGLFNDPAQRQGLLIRLRCDLSSVGLAAPSVTVRIGGTVAPISAMSSVGNEHWLVVSTPNQTTAGSYLLEVEWSDGGIKRFARQKNAVSYDAVGEAHDEVVVIDRSGSMLSSDKYLAARTAANFFVSARGPSDQEGLVTFNTQAVDQLPGMLLLGADGSVNRQMVAAAINNSPNPSGTTSIGQGLKTALENVLPAQQAGRQRSLVLVSDGLENTAPFWDSGPNPVKPLFDQPENTDVVIHTIALGPDADLDLQNVIASSTGGTSRYVYLGNSVSLFGRLADAFKQVEEAIHRADRVFTWAADMRPNSNVTLSIAVPSGALRAKFALSYREPRAAASIANLIGPDGNPLPSSAAVVTRGPTSVVMELTAPPSGSYQMTVTTVRPTEVLVTTSVVLPSVLVGTLVQMASVEDSAMRGRLLAGLIVNGMFVTAVRDSVRLTASVVAPDKSVTLYTLSDDGLSGDGAADDGVWGLPVTLPQGGGYSITFTATDVSKLSARVLRRTIGYFQPRAQDWDLNRIPDAWQRVHFPQMKLGSLNPLTDYDADGLNALEEWRYGTDPRRHDSDGDGRPDGLEVDMATNPLQNDVPLITAADGDGDGLPDQWQLRFFGDASSPQSRAAADPDGDELSNYTEYRSGTNPKQADSDFNGVGDAIEQQWAPVSASTRGWASPVPAAQKFRPPIWAILLLLGALLTVVAIWMTRRPLSPANS